ncbi:MAG: Fur family transcriptional regulator [Solirubrobacterales bacterium]|nr:Fur family transcriptional regulator [Solirubrobacterales bacterium]
MSAHSHTHDSHPGATAWDEHARAALTRAGYRSGAARLAVVDLLARQDCCLSAREIADRLREQGSSVGLASVYRALEVLDELGLLGRLDSGEGTVRYEPAYPNGHHHHHLVCDHCGRVTPFEDDGLEAAIYSLAKQLDYEVAGHDVVLRGSCPDCRLAQKR